MGSTRHGTLGEGIGYLLIGGSFARRHWRFLRAAFAAGWKPALLEALASHSRPIDSGLETHAPRSFALFIGISLACGRADRAPRVLRTFHRRQPTAHGPPPTCPGVAERSRTAHMMKHRPVYLDTSVLGGYFDLEFAESTRRLWELMLHGEYRFFTSEVTAAEILDAPAPVRGLFAETFPDLIEVGVEAEALADDYVAAKVVSERFRDDARHVAVCSLSGISPLVSWNFKHLVNLRREEGFNATNLLRGLPMLRIVSPLELLNDDEDE